MTGTVTLYLRHNVIEEFYFQLFLNPWIFPCHLIHTYPKAVFRIIQSQFMEKKTDESLGTVPLAEQNLYRLLRPRVCIVEIS
jgi:hypothetical protein